jgi:hypothetical protein
VPIINVAHAICILAGWINAGRSEALETSGNANGKTKMAKRQIAHAFRRKMVAKVSLKKRIGSVNLS